MPFSLLSNLVNELTGSYLLYYRARFLWGNNNLNQLLDTPYNRPQTYLGAIEAGSLSIEPNRDVEQVFSDERGPRSPIDEIYLASNYRIRFTLQEINWPAVMRLVEPWTRNLTTQIQEGFPEIGMVPGIKWTSTLGDMKLVPMYSNGSLNRRRRNAAEDPVQAGKIIHFYQVGVDSNETLRESYSAGLAKTEVVLRAQPCRSTDGTDGTEVYYRYTGVL